MQHILQIIVQQRKTAECKNNAIVYATTDKKAHAIAQYKQAISNLRESERYASWLHCRANDYRPWIEGQMYAEDYLRIVRDTISIFKQIKTKAA